MNEVIACRDAMAILPTGGGKSLCFQVPAMAMEGICLVVTPLVALMQDQVQQLTRRNIPALAIHTGMPFRELKLTMERAIHGRYKFLYVSPERLETRLFREYLPAMPLNLIAVDEAHCISQWGYDFRPSYLNIAGLRTEKPDIPVLALTASATAIVQDDILDKLRMPGAVIFRQSFERANLSYSCFTVDSRYEKLVNILKNVTGSAIVYCKSRKRTKEVSDLLTQEKMTAAFYHAGLSNEIRKERQEQWIRNDVRVMVSTNAFGMGIDKPDVRIVVHLDSPDCIENYYQEAGRAGRDQKKAYAVLLLQPGDKEELRSQPALRFPEMLVIRAIYDALCNFLQIPVYSGADTSFDLDLNEFVKSFRLNLKQVIYSLQALQQSGIVTYQEQLFFPSTVCFTTGKEKLQEMEAAHSTYDPLIKALLRTYGGIFDFPSPISEKQLAKMLYTEASQIISALTDLHNARIISYQPMKDSPQIRFLKNRVQTEDLTIDLISYNKRKEIYTEKVSQMIGYAETSLCRSVFTGKYFGDAEIKDCGICDNCLKRKKQLTSKKEFELIAQKITAQLKSGLTVKDILKLNPEIKAEKIMEVIGEWEAENKIRITDDGKIELKKKGQDRNPARF